MVIRARRAAAFAAAVAAGWAPALVAHACPTCQVGQDNDYRLIAALGAFVLVPVGIVLAIVFAVRHIRREEEASRVGVVTRRRRAPASRRPPAASPGAAEGAPTLRSV